MVEVKIHIYFINCSLKIIFNTGDSPFAKEKRSEVKRIMESGARPVQPDICSDEL